PIEGVRISINDLLAARPSSSGNSIEGSGNTSPTSSIVPKYKEFGQFKLFESHQVPEPCRLRVNKNRRAPGPCGIPSLDCSNGYGHFSSKHPELSQPLDFKLMNTDFDFDANLALFNKESLSDNEKESSSPELRDGGSSTSRNFRHDENILDDPSRVISWLSNSQQQVATMFKPLRLESTNEGFLIPVLSSDDKLRYLKEAENFLGSDVLYSIVADRLLLYVLNIMDRFELLVKTVVVLVSESTPEKLASRTLQHLSNRSCTTVVYGIRSNAKNSLPYISFVDQVSKIPVETQLVIILNNSPLPKALQMWLKRVGNGPDASHIISFENKALDVAHPHTLYVGTLAEQSYTTSNNGKHSVFRESAVTEVGCPFGWFEEESYQALIEAFGSQVFVNF
uniref:DFDF domain-containing protein n=1 Tax=Acrobeloides nanus TaxID=290746 RepID=A0A914C2Z4_9BILA